MKSRGFTLIELLVVIAVIGILASVVLASLNSARSKARDAKRTADIRSVQTALEMYYADNGAYPVSTDVVFPGILATALVPTYIGSIPVDPSGATYRYYTNNLPTMYAIRIAYETKTQCYVGGGTVSPSGHWALALCQ